MSDPALRLDKWLWYARFFKSRSLATKLCASGKLRVNGDAISKAHHGVRVGDVLTFAKGCDVRIIRVVALGKRRGPAPEAQTLYEDLDPPTRRRVNVAQPLVPRRDAGSGRPTKAERRATDRLRGDD